MLLCMSYVFEYKHICKSAGMSIRTFSFFVCVWGGGLNNVIFPYNFCFSFNHTLFQRICLAPSKRKREMRGLFPFSFSLQILNYLLLLHHLPIPFLPCLLLGGARKDNFLACFWLQLSLLPRTLQILYAASHFFSAFILFSLYLSCTILKV